MTSEVFVYLVVEHKEVVLSRKIFQSIMTDECAKDEE